MRLCAKAVVEGDTIAGRLAIDLGADLEGSILRMAPGRAACGDSRGARAADVS